MLWSESYASLCQQPDPKTSFCCGTCSSPAVSSPTWVWKAVETWAAKNGYRQEQDVEMLSVLEDATNSTAAVEEWRSAVLGRLRERGARAQVWLLRRFLAVASSPPRYRGYVVPIRPRCGRDGGATGGRDSAQARRKSRHGASHARFVSWLVPSARRRLVSQLLSLGCRAPAGRRRY